MTARNSISGGTITFRWAVTSRFTRAPQAIRCTQCRGLTYQRSERCTNCNFNLHHHRIERARKEKRRRLMHMILFCGIPGLLIIFTGTKFFAGHDVLYFLGAGGGLLLAAMLAALRIAQISVEK